MGDVKDILGVPRQGLAAPPTKSKKKDEPKLVKPKGMSRCAVDSQQTTLGLSRSCWEPEPAAAACHGPPPTPSAARAAAARRRPTSLPLPPHSQGGVCAAERVAPADAVPADGRYSKEGGGGWFEGEGAEGPARRGHFPGAVRRRVDACLDWWASAYAGLAGRHGAAAARRCVCIGRGAAAGLAHVPAAAAGCCLGGQRGAHCCCQSPCRLLARQLLADPPLSSAWRLQPVQRCKLRHTQRRASPLRCHSPWLLTLCTPLPLQWRKFRNPARGDELELEHWVKCFRDAQARLGIGLID